MMERQTSFIMLQCFLHCQGTLRASSRLHDELFRRILRSPMKFFDTTPTGRILNRFSKDMDEGISHCMHCKSHIQTSVNSLIFSGLFLLGGSYPVSVAKCVVGIDEARIGAYLGYDSRRHLISSLSVNL